jgi:hypothetical protein
MMVISLKLLFDMHNSAIYAENSLLNPWSIEPNTTDTAGSQSFSQSILEKMYAQGMR